MGQSIALSNASHAQPSIKLISVKSIINTICYWPLDPFWKLLYMSVFCRATYLSEEPVFGGSSKLLVRLHAAFMFIAWIGSASSVIVLTRWRNLILFISFEMKGAEFNFSDIWNKCGLEVNCVAKTNQWFAITCLSFFRIIANHSNEYFKFTEIYQWHRFFMVYCLTIAPFISIFIELGAWSLQPIFVQVTWNGTPIDNIVLWSNFILCNLYIEVVTTFYGVELKETDLPAWFNLIMAAFVAFYVFIYLR